MPTVIRLKSSIDTTTRNSFRRRIDLTEPAKASVQYGDLKGTVAIDGYNGLSIDDTILTASVPKGYRPIGLRLYGFGKGNNSPSIKAKVLCVDTDQTGSPPDAIRGFGKANGVLHAFEFDATFDLATFAKLVKRFDVVLLSKLVRDIEICVQPIED